MENGNARDYVNHNPDIDPRPLIQGISHGLFYLHRREEGRVVHGDLKGYNVLISDNGEALLTDFGFSSLAMSSFSLSMSAAKGPGTLRWKAPELLEDNDPTIETDVWGFGMTALELFTRSDPYCNVRSVVGVTVAITRGPPAQPDEGTCPLLTNEWWGILRGCWEPNPKKRLGISVIVDAVDT
ncbi:hypothetical protein ID866_9267 [Astraeus odoratus]|nr:hypothetical protein ID866_9267 [Astraeus odoratus]